MTFGQLQTAVYQVCGYPTPVQPTVVARVKNWINEAHRHCLRQPGLVELRQRSGLPFISVPGQAVYHFPLAFERIDAVVERATTRRLKAVSRDVFRSVDPAETSRGTPSAYAPEGWQPRFAVPREWPAPAAPVVADFGVGTYSATPRYYRLRWRAIDGFVPGQPPPPVPADDYVTVRESAMGTPAVRFTPSGTGAGALITRPAPLGQGETHWIICASTDDLTYYEIASAVIADTTYLDGLEPAAYGGDFQQAVDLASSAIWAASTSPRDVTQEVRLIGIRSNGDYAAEQRATLTGQARVRVGRGVIMTEQIVPSGPYSRTLDFIDLVSWNISSVCDGDITLYDAKDGGRQLARIFAGLMSTQYWCVRLWPTPSSAIRYYVDGQIEIPNLVNETDIPMLPPSYHDLLAAFARTREYERTGDSRFAVAASEWERGLGMLRAFVNFPDDWKPVAGAISSATRQSNLGGDFPADWGWP